MPAQKPSRPQRTGTALVLPRVDAEDTQRALDRIKAGAAQLQAQVTAISAAAAPSTFTATLSGTVPASGGGAVNFLRADGAWADPIGSVKFGRLLAVQVLTAPSGTYTPTAGTTFARLRMVGAGGGSGGVPVCAGNQAVSGGGASGVYLETIIGTPGSGAPLTGGAYACGVAGTAGATTPTDGGTGGDTTIIIGAGSWVAKGGQGSVQGLAAASGLRQPGAIQAGSTGAASVSHGENGSPGLNISATVFYGGAGGGSPLGSGGAIDSNGPGAIGTGFGSGGGGAATNGVARTGAAGQPGQIIVEDYS